MPVAPHEDMIGGPLSDELTGRVLEYRYSTGNHYRIYFEEGGVRFDMLSLAGGAPPPKPIDAYGNPVDTLAPMAYRCRKLREDMFLVHWLLRPGIHVALVIDFGLKLVHVSAMMPPNQWEFFDVADIISDNKA